jgi:hypothetical protein
MVWSIPAFHAISRAGERRGRRRVGSRSMEIVLDLLKYGLIFGVLATAPLVLWLAGAWLLTDRRRSPSRSDRS